MTTPTGILFADPRVKPLSTTGLQQAGCYYCFFTTGTTTPANVYSDGGLTTPLSQPTPGSVNPTGGTVSDSAGRFVPIYLDPSVIYRAQLYSAGGSLLEDTDPYVVPVSNGLFAAGTVASPSISFRGDTDTGLYNAAANTIGVAVGGLEVMSIANGAIQGYGPQATALVDMTPDSGSFTVTLLGCTTTPTATALWRRMGNLVTITIPSLTATSNSASCSLSGLPSNLQPSSALSGQIIALGCGAMKDNGSTGNNTYDIEVSHSSGTMTLFKGGSTAGFTSTGTKGFNNTTSFTYALA